MSIGNRNRDLPACSAMPKPTASPRTPFQRGFRYNFACTYISPLSVRFGVMCPAPGSVQFDAEGKGNFLPKRRQQFSAARNSDPIRESRLGATASN